MLKPHLSLPLCLTGRDGTLWHRESAQWRPIYIYIYIYIYTYIYIYIYRKVYKFDAFVCPTYGAIHCLGQWYVSETSYPSYWLPEESSLSLSLSLWLEPIQSLAPDPGSGECSSCHIRQLVYELQKGQCLERKSRRHGSLFGHSTADKPALFLSLSWACILTIIHYLAPTWSTFHLLLLSALQGFLLKRWCHAGSVEVQTFKKAFPGLVFSDNTPASCKQTAQWHVHSANKVFWQQWN